MAKLESEIQSDVLDLLERHKICHWRQHLGPLVIGGGKWVENPLKGMPDVLGVIGHGRLFAIELKKPKTGRLSPEQESWKDRLIEAGVYYCVARSVADVENFLFGKPKKEPA